MASKRWAGDDVMADEFAVWLQSTGGSSSPSMVVVRGEGDGVGDQCREDEGRYTEG